MSASEERLYFLLQVAAHRLRKTADSTLMAHAGLTTAQIAVLSLIEAGKDVNQRDLARRLQQNESAMTAMIQRLLKAGLVNRQQSKTDGRNWVLHLTAQGRRTLEAAHGPFQEINERLDRALGSEDSRKVTAALNAIIEAFSEKS
mgnify:CR=1 FL=1